MVHSSETKLFSDPYIVWQMPTQDQVKRQGNHW